MKEGIDQLNQMTQQRPSLDLNVFDTLVRNIAKGPLSSPSEVIADVLNTYIALMMTAGDKV